ncbi:MAG: aminotransferase class V-fold PLP-dependent enzyme, partial [Proteobacteria bacterium]|nr:aminotransferase class V-fold PLP-dependent enzyme [Pseudomonadota bacterium]
MAGSGVGSRNSSNILVAVHFGWYWRIGRGQDKLCSRISPHPAVLDAMDHAYRHEYANVHRGLHYLSNTATQRFEDARLS